MSNGYIAQPKDYWIAPNAVYITLNALGEANRIQGSVASGASIMCWIEGVDGLGYTNGHEYQTWPLTLSPTYFNSDTEKYVYCAIPRRPDAGTQAAIVFPSELLNIEGKNEAGEQVGLADYYYIFLQGIIGAPAPDKDIDGSPLRRRWSRRIGPNDWGFLDTAAARDAQLNKSEWYEYSVVSEIVTFLRNIKQKAGSTFLNLILNNKELTDVATDNTAPPTSTSHIVTPAYVSSNYLSKQSDDIAQGVIGFVSGLWVKAKGLFGIDGEGNGRFNNIDFSGILSGLRAVINNIESGNYDGDGTSGSGWQLTNDDGTGNSRLVVDNLYVRMKSVYNELEIRKMLHTAGNYIFSPSGSIIEQVDYYAGDELLGYEAVKVPWVLRLVPLSLRGKLLSRTRMRKVSTLSDDDKARVTKFRCWVVADDGTTRTINTWKVGMLARCETFNVAGGKDVHADDTDSGIISEVSEVSGKATGNKFYWREVTETGEGQKLHVDDGKVHNYVDLTNEDGFFFPGSDWPSAGDSIVCYGVTDESLAEYSNIVIIETVGADAPAIKEFQNVGLWGDGETRKGAVNWSLAGKMRTKISPRTGNKFYGEFLVWVKDGWQDMTTTFEIRLGEVRSEIRAVRDTNMLTGVIDGSGWVDFEERLVKAGVTRDGGLYSASGKIISPFFDGGHELYYFSFYAKGEVTLKLNRYSDDGDDRTADMVSSEVLHVSVADGDTYNGMQRYYTNAQVTEGFYCLLFEGTSADNAVYFPQAEEGQLTPFVVSGMETGSAITQSADRISLMVKSDLSKAGVVIEDDHVDLVGGKVNFVDAGGDAYIKVEKADNGINFVFMGRDADGNLIPMYNLGNTGLRQLVNNAVPDRWESAVFMCVGTKTKDAEDYSLRSINPEEKINPLLLCHPEDYDKEWFEGSWKQDPLVDTCIREMAVWRFHEGYTLDAQGRRIYNIGGSQGASEYDGRWCYDQSTDGAGAPVNFVNDNRGGWFFCGSDALWIDNGDALRTYGIEYKENKAEYVSAGKKVTEVWYTSKLTNERGEKVADGLVNNTGGTDLEGYTHVPFDGQGGREMVMPSAEE